jgi:Tfp pilus assembly protein PilF
MKKLAIQLLAVVLIFSLGGCGLNKMVDNAKNVKYQVNPNPLELQAGKVPLEINVTFPAKYFNKKAYLVITPFLVSKDGKDKIQFGSQTLQGEKVQDNNPVIPYKAGGSYTYRDTVAYNAVYRMSDLELHINASKGGNGKTYNFAAVKIANGIITTPELVEKGLIVDNGRLGNTMVGLMRAITPTVALPPSTTEKKSLVLYYPLQKDRLTSKEQRKPDVDSFLTTIKQLKKDTTDVKFQNVTIASYASPDGPIKLNHDLVQGRGQNSTSFITSKLKKEKVADAKDFLKRETTPDEDWAGFKKAVQESNLADKDVILRVLSMYSDPNVREKEIKNMAAVYDKLKKEILPKLRRSEIIATYETRQKTPAELVSLGKSNPSSLSQVELFYGATAAEGTDKEIIYKNYISRYPQDWKGFNNLAVYYLKDNKLDSAETYLQKAEAAQQNVATVLNNYGVLEWAKGDRAKAAEYFNKAASLESNDDINYNLGVIAITEAKYDKAVQDFGSTSSFNKSLAQLLAGNTTDAINTLANVKSECAYYYYLKAVEAARNNSANDVFTNLKQAISKKADLKSYAANDLEFRNFFEDETFKSIVQ